MNMWTKLKLWIAYKLGVGVLLKRPDVALSILLRKYDNRILMQWGVTISQYMTQKAGPARWEKVMKVLVLRLDHLIRGIRYGYK